MLSHVPRSLFSLLTFGPKRILKRGFPVQLTRTDFQHISLFPVAPVRAALGQLERKAGV